MWGYMLEGALTRIDSLQTYYFSVIEKYEKRLKEEAKKGGFAAYAKVYLQMYMQQDMLSDSDRIIFKRAQERVGQYIEIREQNQSDANVLWYRILNKEALNEKGYNADVDEAYKSFRDAIDKYEILNNSTLIMLISRFEEYVAEFLTELFGMYPAKYLEKIQIPYFDIQASSDFDKLKKKIISQRVDECMRSSFKDWFKIFDEHKLNYKTYFNDMHTLTEIYARRNIWTHNCGYVNESYLTLVDASKYKLDDKAMIDRNYISMAFEIIKKILFVISIEACKMLEKESGAEQIEQIFHLAFNVMTNGEYSVCIPAFECIKEHKYTSLDYKYMSMINIWISEKAQNGLQCCKSQIESFDTSALREQFQLAKLLLLDKNEEATEMLRRLLEKNDIDFYSVKNWPLYKDYRSTDFYQTIKKEFEEEYSVENLDTSNATCVDTTMQLLDRNISSSNEDAQIP